MSLSKLNISNEVTDNTTSYNCAICEHNSKQKSHHLTHVNTKKHKQQVKIFKLNLEKLSEDERFITYKERDINKIITLMTTVINKSVKKLNTELDNIKKEDEDIEFDKQYENKEIWNILNNPDDNLNYGEYHIQLENVIKKCHQILYSECSIVGIKAMNDISKILIIKLLEKEFSNIHSDLYLKLTNVTDADPTLKQYIKYLQNIKNLGNEEGNQINKWATMTTKILSVILKGIYYSDDSGFNFKDNNILIQLIDEIDKLKITDGFLDAFSASCGDIHESFCKYGGKKASKELGQFFTPRKLINLVFHGFNLTDMCKDMQNPTIFDPCMGTGGFLTRIYKLLHIKPENIFGCETETDTIKFAFSSIHLTTKQYKSTLTKCNSLCENPLLPTKKHNLIVTNPPFGTKMDYAKLKEKYENMDFGDDNDVTFEDIYPLKTNNGACLFTQMCVYKLAQNGICVIVLPDGELFEGNSKWSISFRKWLCNTVNIKIILKVPSGTFEHAGVTTNVVIFKNNGPTKKIKFYTTDKECSFIKTLFNVTMKELQQTNFSLDVGRYLKPEVFDYTVPMIKLGDICEIKTGIKINSDQGLSTGLYPLYYCSIIGCLWLNNYTYDNEGIIINSTNGSGKCKIYYNNGKYNVGNSTFHFISKDNNKILNKYVYLYLLFNIKILESNFKGVDKKSITKERLFNIKIPAPSLEIQQQCIKIYEEKEEHINSIQTRIDNELAYLDQLKQLGKDIISSFCNNETATDTNTDINYKKHINITKEYTICDEIYIKQSVKGDGHCFFKAVSLYTNFDIEELRNMTANYIRDNIDDYKNTYLPEEHEGLSLEEYIEKIRNTNEWADNDSIVALQKALNRSIKIYNEEGAIMIGSDIESSEEPIYIVYNGEDHYDSLIKK
jgi:type I restriction-modification system DNA methylase subunit